MLSAASLFYMGCGNDSSSTGAGEDLSSSSILGVSSVEGYSSSVILSSSASVYWNTNISYGSLTDPRDNHTYRTVVIGTQTWMAENLAYLPSVNDASDNSYSDAKYYVNGYDGTILVDAKAHTITSNWIRVNSYDIFGVLYNWIAASSACPSGWHLPSDSEWTTLENFVNSSLTVGARLEANSDLWAEGYGTDDWGFSALPGGDYYDSSFSGAGGSGYWWTATEVDSTQALNRIMSTYRIYRAEVRKKFGHSVRCIQD